MKKVLQTIAVTIASLGLTAGVVSASSVVIGTTGPSSNNQVAESNTWASVKTNANTALGVNSNNQSGTTGTAGVNNNTTGGSAMSGNVNNTAMASTVFSISNAGGAGGPVMAPNSTSINVTGPNSNNQVSYNNSYSSVVTNVNTVSVTNTNSQNGSSGSANVSNNTTGGSAVSGSVSNTSTFSTTSSISN